MVRRAGFRSGEARRAATLGGALALAAVTALGLSTMREASAMNLFGVDIAPPTDADFMQHDQATIELGRLLFYDKVISGNRNISCGGCHNHDQLSADKLSLGVGEGGEGLGPDRVTRSSDGRAKQRVPRNAPALFNLGAHEFTTMFHDGRVKKDIGRRYMFITPAGEYLPQGLESALAAQALFPITSQVEMAGEPQTNPIGAAASRHPSLAWPLVVERIRETPGYPELFKAAFGHIKSAEDITIVDYGNAMAAFIGFEWRADNSPFDRYLRGEESAMSAQARHGMDLFYGEAGCGQCHSGKFQTDHDFHAIAMPQIGPGKTLGFEHLTSDFGRLAISHERDDVFKFRTPSLRNVTLTAPYGHSGAYATLEAVVRHHLDPEAAFRAYDGHQAVLPYDTFIARQDRTVEQNQEEAEAILEANELEPVELSDADVEAVMAFLAALTDEKGARGRLGKPDAVPSGLKPE